MKNQKTPNLKAHPAGKTRKKKLAEKDAREGRKGMETKQNHQIRLLGESDNPRLSNL